MNYDLVIFDLDGTLMDTAPGIFDSIAKTCRDMSFTMPPINELKDIIGPPIQFTLKKIFNMTDDQMWEMLNIYRGYYESEGCYIAEPFKGIYDAIKTVRARGMKTAVATNKREKYARLMMDHFGFAPWMDIVHGTDYFGEQKKADIIRLCAKDCGVTDMSRVLMIGDSFNDSDGAKAAGCAFLGLYYGYGFHTKEEAMAVGAVACAGSVEKLKKLLENI